MKNLLIFCVIILGFNQLIGQIIILDTSISVKDAGEGDLYQGDPSGIIYIGLTDGSYQPISKNLKEILAQANDANNSKIINLGTPTDAKDAVTKEYVDNLAGGGIWKLTGNTTTTSSNFVGTTDAQDLVLKSNNSERLRLVNNKGQVLINQATSFNTHPLVIKANGNDVLAFEDTSGTPKWHWSLLSNGLNFVESVNLDSRLFLQNGGNVGINTQTPSSKLHVNGDLRVIDAFKDSNGDSGNIGQVLSSTSTGTAWTNSNSSVTNPVEGTGLILAINTYTANSNLTTILTPDHYTIILEGSEVHTLDLPPALGNIGLVYNIKNLGDKDADIDLYIDYQGQDIYRVQKQKMLILQSDGINWQQIN